MNKEFTKQDLKTGMLVQFRDGDLRLVVSHGKNNEFYFIGKYVGNLSDYNNDLTCSYDSDLDVVKVYSQTKYVSNYLNISVVGRELLWERKEDDNKRKENIKKKNEMLEQREKLVKEIEDKKKQLFVLDKSYNQFIEENFKEDKEYYIPKDNTYCIKINGKPLMDVINEFIK